VSIVIPCFNEAASLRALVRRVLDAPLNLRKEVIIVDDGSTDGSADIAREIAAAGGAPGDRVIAIHHPVNRGKGAALASAFSMASGDIVLIQDADLEYSPDDYPVLIRPIVDGVSEAVYGSRWINRHMRSQLPGHWKYVAGNWIVTAVANLLYGANLTDQCTGYKVMSGDLARRLDLSTTGFEVCGEITAKIRLMGCSVWEVPIYYEPRTVAQGKKIRAVDAARAMWTLAILRLRAPAFKPVSTAQHPRQ
jgi:glycosyltransferase involved in cell wall biosynthesis